MKGSLIKLAKEKLPLSQLLKNLGKANYREVNPLREDQKNSFSLYVMADGEEKWRDHGRDFGGDQIDFLVHFFGLSQAEARDKFFELAGVSSPKESHKAPAVRGEVVARYDYFDAQGVPLYQVQRHEPKTFTQHRYVEGKLVPGMEGIIRVPYRLPEVINAQTVWVVEGEKDSENLSKLGLCATCNAGGAGKWESTWNQYFKDKEIVLCGDNDEPGERHAQKVEAILKPIAKSFRRVKVPTPHKDISDFLKGKNNEEALLLISELLAQTSEQDQKISKLLDSRAYRHEFPPQEPVTLLSFKGQSLATAENIQAILGQAKAGKTAVVSAVLASFMNPTGDCLGFSGCNASEGAVIHLDFEQSAWHFHQLLEVTLKRAGWSYPPPWLRAFILKDLDINIRMEALEFEIKRAQKLFGAVTCVILDGLADLLLGVNDEKESLFMVSKIEKLAVTYHCAIFCVLHENPGQASALSGKMRGHLGSQLERKAESNIRVDKDSDNISCIWVEKGRTASVPKSCGHKFSWNEEQHMHLTIESEIKQSISEVKIGSHKLSVEHIFGNQELGYKQVVDAFMALDKKASLRTAERRIKEWVDLNLIYKTILGLYKKV